MTGLRDRARFATLLAVGLALLVSGVVAGAAGGNFILGQANSAGSSNSSLTTSSSGTALLVTQNGTGTAIRGSTGSGSGIAGFFTSGSGSGVSGVVANENSFGVYAGNDSPNEGTGAAIRASGQQNEGVIATSADSNALRGVVTGCDGFLCGGNGVSAKGYGFAAGVYGDGSASIAGVWASEGQAASVYATQTGADIPAVYGSSTDGTAVYGAGYLGSGDVSDLPNAGGAFVGLYGVIGQTDTGFGAGVYARTNAALSYALYADGNSYVNGNFTINGTCTGCAAAAIALNGSTSTLKQGDAVALDGVQQAADGSIVMVVRAAKKGDAVIGVVDRQLVAAAATTKVGGTRQAVKVNRGADREVATSSRSVSAPKGLWGEGGTSVAADSYLRIITGGLYAFAGTAPAGAVAGDALAVDTSGGKLAKESAGGAHAGRYLGKLKDGRIVLMVDPR